MERQRPTWKTKTSQDVKKAFQDIFQVWGGGADVIHSEEGMVKLQKHGAH